MNKTNKIKKALIVDDERLARKELISMLGEFESIRVCGEADSVESAIKEIEKTDPDIVFLDIQMPGKSGFDLINENEFKAKVIFVTAFDEYAIRAFEVNALDYLLKPVSNERLQESIQRIFLEFPPTKIFTRKLNYSDKLFLDIGNKTQFLKISDIVCIHAEGDYTMLRLRNEKKGLVTKSMKEWEQRLPENIFCRIHRSSIINTEYIERIEKYYNYSYKITLKGENEPLIISRRYAKKIKEIFG